MVRSLMLRGLAVGALAGLVTFCFAWVFGEPVIEAAIEYEGARGAAQEALNNAAGLPVEPAGDDLVSRGVQGTFGIGLGLVLFGMAMGALLAVGFSLAWGRVTGLRPRVLALLLAVAGFVTLYLVPFLKYPVTPPAVGHEDTIGARTGLYLVMVVASVLAAATALWLGRALAARIGGWNATLAGLGGFVVLVGLVMAVLPALGELAVNVAQYGPQRTETTGPLRDPSGVIVFPGFDPDLLYDFRLYSVASVALLWTVLGLGYGAATERLLSRAGQVPPARASAQA